MNSDSSVNIEDTLEALNNTDPADLADMYLNFRAEVEEYLPHEISESDATEIRNIVGGEPQYQEMIEWADSNLTDKEIEMFDVDSARTSVCFQLRQQNKMNQSSLCINKKLQANSVM